MDETQQGHIDQSAEPAAHPDQDVFAGRDPTAGDDLVPTELASVGLASGTDCPHCGVADAAEPVTQYVYALGRIEPRYPTQSIEMEFAQAIGRVDTEGMTDRAALKEALSAVENRYLARQLCWVLTIEGIETYLVVPRYEGDVDLLVQALRADPAPGDLDAVIGHRGPLGGPQMCNGLTLPVVAFDQLYSFDRDTLLDAIPKPEGMRADRFRTACEQVFDRLLRITDNAGATDEHRALNYLAVRYPTIYSRAAKAFSDDFALSAVDVTPSTLSTVRNIVDVVFSFRHRKTDFLEKSLVRVDVTEEFPFLVSKLAPSYDVQ